MVVAEDVRCYKPERRPFTRMLDKLSLAPEEVLHVAFGFKYDIGDRQGAGHADGVDQPPPRAAPDADAAPDHEWRDLWGLAELAERD